MQTIGNTLSLDELAGLIRSKFGKDFEHDMVFVTREHNDGSAEGILFVQRAIRATWRSRLIKMPPRDGVTPRGPKEYYDFQFISPAPKS